MVRTPCCAKEGLNRGAWTPLEDSTLTNYIKSHGEGKWRILPKRAGLKRCGKSCRLRWMNYLRPDIKRGNITHDEEDLIIRLHKLLGNRWSLIAGRLPGRTDNEIKNYWNTNLNKKIHGGHPSSTKKCKPRRPSHVLPPNSENVGSCVVIRTKARRCSKVFFNADMQTSAPQFGAMALKSSSSADPDPTSGGVFESPAFSGQNVGFSDSSSGFVMDFEMDDKFVSEFLNTDLVALEHDFDKGVAQDTNTETNNVANDGIMNSCPNAFLDDHLDPGSMASFLYPAVDWLNDQDE